MYLAARHFSGTDQTDRVAPLGVGNNQQPPSGGSPERDISLLIYRMIGVWVSDTQIVQQHRRGFTKVHMVLFHISLSFGRIPYER